jgi:hypothetical protein
MGCLSDDRTFYRNAGNSSITLAPGAAVASGTAITLTLPGDYPTANDQPLFSSSAGALSWGQVLGTGGTPQFTRLGLGAAADATIPLYVASGIVGIGDNADALMTQGLVLNQGAADDEIFACKSSDIAHGITSNAETDTYFTITKTHATLGGAHLTGYSETAYGINLIGAAGSVPAGLTAKDATALAPVMVRALQKSGTTLANMSADQNLFVIINGSFGSSAKLILDAEGQLVLNETSTDTFPTIDCKQSSTGDVGIRFGLGSTISAMIGLDNSNGDRLAFAFAASATAVLGTGDVFALWSTGNCQSGPDGAGATGDTTGYWYVRNCAGTPTGVPTSITGYNAMRWDSTNKKMYVYDGGWVALN